MKTKIRLSLLAMTAAALSLNATTGVGQVFNAKDVINNRAVANSPRAKEELPWLTPSDTDPTCSQKAATTAKSAALAASPRIKELFPELARPTASPSESAVATRSGINALTEVRRNSALAASPRMKELFPELARGAERTIEVAPVK